MKILFIAADTNKIGGIEKYNINLLEALNKFDQNIKKIELNRLNLLAKMIFVFKIIFQSVIFRPDIIFCAHINFSIPCFFIKKILGIDYIVFTHGIDVWHIKSRFKRKALRGAKKIISVSNFTQKKLIEQLPEIKDKAFLLFNSVDGSIFYPKNKSENLIEKFNLKEKKIIFTLARLSGAEGYKGYDKAIDALSRIIKEVPDVVYIVGGSGDDIARIKNLIKDKKLENYVILTGFISNNELIDYYNLCDVFVMPSKGEGFGIVFLEALACGKPVVAGNQDGSVDAVLGGKIGVLVNPDNTDEIAQAIIKILKQQVDKNLLNAESLRKNVLETYGIDKFNKMVKNLIYELSR